MNDQRYCVAHCPHRELAIGWALHALEPAEESLFAAHLPDCPECTRLAAETEEVGATLGLSVPTALPSAALEQRVLSVTGARWEAPVVPLAPSARPNAMLSRLRVKELVAAAAVVLVAAATVLGVQVVQLNGALHQASHQVTAMSEAMQRAADPAVTRVPLVTNDGQPVAMVLASRDKLAVVTTHLPGNQVADHTYVLWGLTGGAPIALAAFDVAPEAPGLHPVPTATGARDFTGYAVSLEPGRRAPVLPTDVLAKGQVAG